MVGCGRISEMYSAVFKQLSAKVEVAYAVDVEIDKARNFANDFEGCIPVTDYRECFNKSIDVIHIATPHYLHPIIAIDAMKNKINVLTEKPMAINLKDADEMIKVAEEEGVKLGVIFQTRYVKGCMELKRLIEEGGLGRIIAARSYLSWSRSDEYYSDTEWKGTWDKGQCCQVKKFSTHGYWGNYHVIRILISVLVEGLSNILHIYKNI